MNFVETSTKFGPYTKITVSSKEGVCFSVIPELGARLNNFVVQTKTETINIIDGYSTVDEFLTGYRSKSSLLAPFPNRIADGVYKFEGNYYLLEINKPLEHNAIHGFVADKVFTIVRSGEIDDQFEIVLEYSCEGTSGYPFPFLAEITYALSGHSLSVNTLIRNTGISAIPLGIGWHPYFTFNNQIDDSKLRLPKMNQLHVNERSIPTGELSENSDWVISKSIAGTNFDTGFQFISDDKRIIISKPETGLGVEISCGETYKYLQVFIPPQRTSIAIEPMTCATDAFNNGMGLIHIKAGDYFSAEFTISILELSKANDSFV